MTTLEILKHAHSSWRWVVLILLLAAISNAFLKWNRLRSTTPSPEEGKSFLEHQEDKPQDGWTAADKKLNMFALAAAHIQMLMGIFLYAISPYIQAAFSDFKGAMGNGLLRYFAVEHISVMLIGIFFITFGYSKGKRIKDTVKAYQTVWLYFGIGLVLILLRIPFGIHGAGWY